MEFDRDQEMSGGKGYIPTQTYRVRCIGTKLSKSSSNFPMTTLDCEIIEPETLTLSGTEVTVAGRTFQLYLIHNPGKVGWASQDQVFEFCEKIAADLPVNPETSRPRYKTEDHRAYYLGREFDIVLQSEEQIKRLPPKPGQKFGQGDPVLDGEGKPISLGYRITANPDDVPANCHPGVNEQVANQPI